MNHTRDYKKEYARRIALAKSRARAFGIKYSRSQARGHARTAKAEVPVSVFKRNSVIRPERQATERRYNKALGFVRDGMSVTAAANKVGMSPVTLRRIGVARGVLERTEATKGSRYKITSRWHSDILTPSGRMYNHVPLDRRTCSTMGRYWNAVHKAIAQTTSAPLLEFQGIKVHDLYGKSYSLCTSVQTLLRIREQDETWGDNIDTESRRRFVYST